MKSTELMIGDLVLVDNNPTKVAQVTKHKIGYHKGGGAFEMCTMSYSRSCEINPISLTPEILEKNGFEFVNDSRIAISSSKLIDNDTSIHFQFYDKKDCFFQLLHCGAGSYEIRKYIKYVHELQHALRLCRLEDIADNFKI